MELAPIDWEPVFASFVFSVMVIFLIFAVTE